VAIDPQPWQVLVPIKRLTDAKSRLSADEVTRQELVVAMAQDTLAAISASPLVTGVGLVCPDRLLAARLTSGQVSWLEEIPGEPDGLNGAITRAVGEVRSQSSVANVAVVVADLPALRPDEVTAALTDAPSNTPSFVSDILGSGTTAVLFPEMSEVALSFGSGSAERHHALGLVALEVGPGLRQDVDTLSDLRSAAALGLGAFTHHVMAARLG
jgi:2-phospho-L-lactate/phosphoenolpyruvate guanylyltransferase